MQWLQHFSEGEMFKQKARSESLVLQFHVLSWFSPALPLPWNIHRLGPLISSTSIFTGQKVLITVHALISLTSFIGIPNSVRMLYMTSLLSQL
jgi:hypothetical protein